MTMVTFCLNVDCKKYRTEFIGKEHSEKHFIS